MQSEWDEDGRLIFELALDTYTIKRSIGGELTKILVIPSITDRQWPILRISKKSQNILKLNYEIDQ